jgi:maleylacetoacetate isomerase/maleylpyruvate isomerase
MKKPKLYTFWDSSSAYRVRIALNLKEVDYESVPVDLRRDGGEHHFPTYRSLNPMQLVPTLVDGEKAIAESMAIIEYLEECRPTPALLPGDPFRRAQIRSMALMIACGVQPLNNVSVLRFLEADLGIDEPGVATWYSRWIERGFAAIESFLCAQQHLPSFCFGDGPSLADVFLVPQVRNAIRWGCDMRSYPSTFAVYEHCRALAPFEKAAPENQPDADIAGEMR